MTCNPTDWSVVAAGAWNPAILTPGGIAQILFKVPEGTQVQVDVPLDAPGLPRLRYDSFVCIVEPLQKLIIALEEPTLQSVDRAKELLVNALEKLPVTPVSGIGVNFNFSSGHTEPAVYDLLKTGLDSAFSDRRLTITRRLAERTLSYKNGELNVKVRGSADADFELKVNCHCSSTDRARLTEWLQIPAVEFHEQVSQILDAFGITQERVQ